MKSFSFYLCTLSMFACVSLQATNENSTLSFSETNRIWHPEEIIIMFTWIDTNVKFKLPYEEDQSGVANLIFQCNKTGAIHMLDKIEKVTLPGFTECIRYYNLDLIFGEFDAILLYNNGKYIRCNDISFKENTIKEIDLTNHVVQPPNSESIHWLTLRKFETETGKRVFERMIFKNDTTSLEKNVRGYIYQIPENEEYKGQGVNGANIITFTDEIIKGTVSTVDGYFEIEVGTGHTLKICWIGQKCQELIINANTGLLVVLKEDPLR